VISPIWAVILSGVLRRAGPASVPVTRKISIVSVELPLDEACAEARGLIEYWQARRLGHELPTRRNIEVLDLWPLLGRLSLHEVLPDGDLRCRVRGTLLGSVPGHIKDGMRVSAAKPADYIEHGTRQLHGTMAARRPRRHRIHLRLGDISHEFERLSLPLAAQGGVEPPMMLTLVLGDHHRGRYFWSEWASGG